MGDIEQVRLSDLPCANPMSGYEAPNRIDPYWGEMWTLGSEAHWTNAGTLRRAVKNGLRYGTVYLVEDEAEAWERFRNGKEWYGRLRGLGAVDSWRTLSVEQLVAFSGCTQWANRKGPALSPAFSMRLLDLGTFKQARPSRMTERRMIVRPAPSQVFKQVVAPELTWPEWVGVTGGQDWRSGGQYSRHNILAAELGLRAAEYLGDEVPVVLGEKLSSMNLLFGEGLKRPRIDSNKAADATLVRDDGLRIAIEITASTGVGFTAKVESWARLLSENPLSTSGVVVVFVIAEPIERDGGVAVLAKAASRVSQMAARYGMSGDVSRRMFVTSWTDWFPGRHMASEGFLRLRASSPGVRQWAPTDLIGPDRIGFSPAIDRDDLTDTQLSRLVDPMALIDNAQSLASTPVWRRDPDEGEPLWPRLVANSGLGRIPAPPSETGLVVGASRGAVGATTPPDDLVGI